VDFGRNTLFGEEARENRRVRGGYPLAVEVFQSGIGFGLGDGQRDTAFAETELVRQCDIEIFLLDFVEADDSQVGYAHGDRLRNVIVAQVEHLDREVLAFGQQLALAVLDGNSCLFEQGDALFVEPAFGLNGDSDHIAIDFYGFFFVLALATVPRMQIAVSG